MDGISILKNIISSGILDEYRSNDPDLSGLIESLGKSFSQWQSLKKIYISNQTVRASKIEPSFQRRFRTIPDAKQISDPDERRLTKELKISLERFLKYLNLHPEVEITFATFNCDRYSYDVKCGIVDQKLDVICVLKGGHVPEDLLAK